MDVFQIPKELGFSKINISFLVILSSLATWQAVSGLSPVIITTYMKESAKKTVQQANSIAS